MIPRNSNDDWIKRIRTSYTRFDAAVSIRAFATHYVATIWRTSADSEAMLQIIDDAERRAQSLERPFAIDEDANPICEADHPWRRWLCQWGY